MMSMKRSAENHEVRLDDMANIQKLADHDKMAELAHHRMAEVNKMRETKHENKTVLRSNCQIQLNRSEQAQIGAVCGLMQRRASNFILHGAEMTALDESNEEMRTDREHENEPNHHQNKNRMNPNRS